MSHSTTRPERPWRGARVALATTMALMAMAVTAGAAQAASFSITKQTDPASDTTTPFTFTVKYEAIYDAGANAQDTQPPAEFTLVGGETKTFDNVHKGLYTVTELTPQGWQLVSITCAPEDPDAEDAYVIDLGAGSAAIELSPDENKACTFLNRQVPLGQPTPPGPPTDVTQSEGTTTQPGIAVLPTVARPSSARLTAPTACVSRRYAVRVTGSPVTSVSWYVNGRFIKRTHAIRRGQRVFATVFAPGAHLQRVQARVSFASDAAPRTRTLRVTIRRCSPAVVRPQFTG